MQQSPKKVSIVIPVYNVEDYLEECLNSVVQQTYGLDNLEIILIDDCSKDSSYQIASLYNTQYPNNIRLLKNERNMGLGKVRNIGVENSTGDYLVFLDSDDILPLDAIEKMMEPISKDPNIDLVIGKHLNFITGRRYNVPIYKQIRLFNEEAVINVKQISLKDLFLIFDLTPACMKLYNLKWLKENKITATENHFYEDAILSTKAIFLANKIKFINHVIYLYRRDNYSSITREFSRKKNDDYLKSITDVRKELLKGDNKGFHLYSDLRLFTMWRTVIFVNCVELIPDHELSDYQDSLARWLKVVNELSAAFTERLPFFWRNIINIINNTRDEEAAALILYFKRLKKANPRLISKSIFHENERQFTFELLLKTYTDIENSLELLNKKISNVHFWRLVRFAVFESLLVQLRLQKNMGGENTFGGSSILNQIERYHTPENSPFYGEGEIENIVFDHSRRQLYKGKYIDYKSYELLENFELNGIDYQVLELPFNGEHYIESSSKRKYLESMFLFMEQQKAASVSFTNEESELLLQIEKEFYLRTGAILDIRPLIKRVIIDFKLKYLYFSKLFKRRGVKKVYLVGAWWNTAIIAAAKDLDIEVIDVQYAAFSKYHLGFSYDYIQQENIPYYPDKIYLWGEYWKNSGELPIAEDNKIVVGNKFIHEKIAEYSYINKQKQVLVLSQGVHGEQINSTAFRLAQILPDYNIVVKLHPKENKEYYINKYTGLPNFSYSDDSIDLFLYMAESQFAISVFSTAVFEAAALGSHVVLLNFSGVEHFIDLVKENVFQLANNAQDIKAIIDKQNEKSFHFDTNYFFSGQTP